MVKLEHKVVSIITTRVLNPNPYQRMVGWGAVTLSGGAVLLYEIRVIITV